MKEWGGFYDMLMPELPGCPQAAADHALRRCAVEFCEQSLVWQAFHPEVAISAGTADYAFSPPEGALVHAILRAALDGGELETSVPGRAGGSLHGQQGGGGSPRYVLGGTTRFTLAPEPAAAGILAMTVVLKPSPDSQGIEDWLFDEYREPIAHGTLARLMLSPKKPYSNIDLAAYHRQQFIVKTAAAGARAATRHARAALQTLLPGPSGRRSEQWA